MNLIHRSFLLAQKIFPSGGVCLEFGVYVGDTYVWQAEQVRDHYPQTELIGFDSWQGLPAETSGVWTPDRHAAGRLQSIKDVVLARLHSLGVASDPIDPRFRLVDGFFSESLTDDLRRSIQRPVIFVNIDVDLHRSTIELLDFVKPLLQPGTVLYWDDWKDPRDDHSDQWGEHLAWEQWSERHKDIRAETIDVNPVNQRTMIVVEANAKSLVDAGLSMSEIRHTAYRLSQPAPRSQPAGVDDSEYQRYLRFASRLHRLPFYSVLRALYRLFAK